MIVQRHTDHLKAGDILPAHGQLPRVVIYRIYTGPGMPIGTRVAWVMRLEDDDRQRMVPPPAPVTFGPDALVAVEAPDLTPAQARAEELLDLLDKITADGCTAETLHSGRRLIYELRPKPPTLEDALRALDGIDPDHMPPSSKAVLERARRTGLL